MAKSVTATMMGVLIRRGDYELTQPAPIPEWQTPGDPRAKIRIVDILQMSSGLRIKSPQDPDYDPTGPYPDHLYLYTGRVNSFQYAATRPQQWPPGTVGRYRNTDPVLTNYLIRLAVEKRGEDYLSFPQRALFDKVGIRTMVIETDPFGQFPGPGLRCCRRATGHGSATSICRTVSGTASGSFQRATPSSSARWRPRGRGQAAHLRRPLLDQRRRHIPVPREAYYMSGAGGQTTLIIPSHDLVVVRLGHFKGARRAAGLQQVTRPPDGSTSESQDS